MLRAKRFLIDNQCSLVERYGLFVLALNPVEACQIVEAGSGAGMVRWKCFLVGGQRSLVE